MKIYYATTKGHSDKDLEALAIKEFPDMLRDLGHEVYEYVYDPVNLDGDLTFDELSAQILNADVFIGEMSRPSQTLGFQLASALNAVKPVLYLYSGSSSGKPDVSISKNPSRLLRVSNYSTADDVKAVLKQFFRFAARQLQTTRTSFVSTKNIDEFISEQSRRLGISKGEAIRQLLDDSIKHHSKND